MEILSSLVHIVCSGMGRGALGVVHPAAARLWCRVNVLELAARGGHCSTSQEVEIQPLCERGDSCKSEGDQK